MNSIIREIHKMNCARVANYAKYVFMTSGEEVEFGSQKLTVAELCERLPNCPARSVKISAWCGPPTTFQYQCLTLSELVQDWYFNCITYKFYDTIEDCEIAMGVPVGVSG